jgi:hypothetical protein
METDTSGMLGSCQSRQHFAPRSQSVCSASVSVAVAAETGVQASTGEAKPASYEKTATFPGSDIELPPGTEVRVAGVPIGEVSEQDKSEAGVSVTMSIDPDYVPICDDATISIRGAGRGSLSELALAFKLIESAQHRWRAVNSAHLVALVRSGAKFENGVLVERPDESTSGDTHAVGHADPQALSIPLEACGCSPDGHLPGAVARRGVAR